MIASSSASSSASRPASTTGRPLTVSRPGSRIMFTMTGSSLISTGPVRTAARAATRPTWRTAGRPRSCATSSTASYAKQRSRRSSTVGSTRSGGQNVRLSVGQVGGLEERRQRAGAAAGRGPRADRQPSDQPRDECEGDGRHDVVAEQPPCAQAHRVHWSTVRQPAQRGHRTTAREWCGWHPRGARPPSLSWPSRPDSMVADGDWYHDHGLPRRRQRHHPRGRAGDARSASPTSRSSASPRTSTGWSQGAEAAAPQVVVSDIRMPPNFQQEGIDGCKEIRKRHPGTGVVILSQYDDPDYAISLLSRGRRRATPTC